MNEYIFRRDKHTNTRFVISPTGDGRYIEDDVSYTRKEFNKKYPLPISLVFHNSANADGSKSYLGTD